MSQPYWGKPGAAPTGLPQQTRGSNVSTAGPYWGSPVQAQQPQDDSWLHRVTQARNAPRWVTGGQWGDTANGYDTPFYETFDRQQREQADKNDLAGLYQRPDFTGIVTYNNIQRGGRTLQVGDVFENGQHTGNLYDQFSRADATQILADLTMGPQERAQAYRAYSRGDHAAVERAVQAKVDEFTTFNDRFATQQVYNQAVDERVDQYENTGIFGSWTDEILTVLAGAGGGAVAGAWGGAPGAIIGGLAGGIAAWANQDSLVHQAASTAVQTEMAFDQFGWGGASTALRGWSGLAGQFIMPLTNIVHGSYDLLHGGVNDGRVAWYEAPDGGAAERGIGWTTLGVVAGLGDAAAQFASGIGAITYMTQMSGSIVGSVGQLITQQGSTWSDQRGDFDNIFLDDDGNFDPVSGAAGIGSIAVDAVQLGIARGLVSKFRSNVTQQPVTQQAGFAFRLDDMGRATWANQTAARSARLSFIAPSEHLTAAVGRVRALRTARARGENAFTADDFYQAVQAISSGTGRWNYALVTGFGESYEEVVQAILDPISHHDIVDWRGVLDAGIQGFAMGTGMYLGSSLRSRYRGQDYRVPDAAEAQMMRGYNNFLSMTGQDPTDSNLERFKATWGGMTESQRTSAANLPAGHRALVRQSIDRMVESQKATQAASVPGIEKVNDAITAILTSATAKAAPRTDGTYVISQASEARYRGESVVASMRQTLTLFNSHVDGLREQIAVIERDPSTPEQQQQIIQLTATVAEATAIQQYLANADSVVEEARARQDEAAIRNQLQEVNERLELWFDNGGPANTPTNTIDPEARNYRRRAASLLFTRPPQEGRGSYLLLMPQVDLDLTLAEADHALMVSLAVMQTIGGDYDGDKVTQLGKLVLDQRGFEDLRMGRALVSVSTQERTGTTEQIPQVNIGTRNYEKQQVSILAGALRSPEATITANATKTISDLQDQIRARYGAIMPKPSMDRILARLDKRLRNGDSFARQELLSDLVTNGGDAFWELSRTNMTNELLWVDLHYQRALQAFAFFVSTHAATTQMVQVGLGTAIPRGTRQHNERQRRAATHGADMALRVDGWSMFRMFQKLHYTEFNAAVVKDKQATLDSTTRDLVQLFESLNRGATQDALEATQERDSVAQRVTVWLENFTRESDAPNRDLAVLANMATANVWLEDGTPRYNDKPITLLQMLIRQAVVQEKHRMAGVAQETDLARWAEFERLAQPGRAGEAFAAVLGGKTLWELMGDASTTVGSQLTVEQFVRLFSGLAPEAKRITSQRIREDASYTRERGAKDMPFDFADVRDGLQINPFTSVMDSILQAGRSRITLRDGSQKPEKGKPKLKNTAGGHIGDRSDSLHESLTRGFTQMHSAFREYGIKGDNVAEIRQLLDTNPRFERMLLDLVDDRDVNAVFTVADGQLRIPDWFYEIFTLPPEEAAMHYWRRLTMSTWYALGADKPSDNPARDYDKMANRFHRLMYRIATGTAGEYRLLELAHEMEQAKDLNRFMAYVNETWRSREEAPYAAWMMDTADFDADKANGGWQAGETSTGQREAIRMLEQRSQSLLKDVQDQRALAASDDTMVKQLRAAIREPNSAPTADRVLVDNLERALEFAKVRLTAISPNEMKTASVALQMAFYGDAYAKGQGPEELEAFGSMQAMSDAHGFGTQFERHADMLVSVDAEDMQTNPQMWAHQGVDVVGHDGALARWDALTTEGLLEMWDNNPQSINFLKSVLFPSAYERTDAGQLTQKFMTSTSLKQLLEADYAKEFFGNDTNSRWLYMSEFDAAGKRNGRHNASTRLLNDVLFAHQSGAKTFLDATAHRNRIDEMGPQVAEILKTVGELYATAGPETLRQAHRAAVQKLQSRVRGRAATAFRKHGELLKDLFKKGLQDKVQELLEKRALALQEGRLEGAEALERTQEMLEAKQEAALDSTAYERHRASVMIDWNGPQSEINERKKYIYEQVQERGTSFGVKVPWALDTLMRLQDPVTIANGIPVIEVNEKADRDHWDLLSNGLVAAYMEDVTSTQAVGVPVPEVDMSREIYKRYMDPTFSYLLDFMDPDSPEARTALDLHERVWGSSMSNVSEGDLAAKLGRLLDDHVINEDKLGAWTMDIPRVAIEAQQRLDSAGAQDSVASQGLVPRRIFTLATATEYTYETDTLRDTVSTGSITLQQLADADSEFDTYLKMRGQDAIPVQTPTRLLNGRFARNIRLMHGDTEVASLDSLGSTLVNRPRVVHSGWRAISVDQLRRALDGVQPTNIPADQLTVSFEFLHPDSQPAERKYYNNIFYEGVGLDWGSETHDSLVAALFVAPGGILQRGMTVALDAQKKGTLAYQLRDLPTEEDRTGYEAGWEINFSQMLTEKATHMMGRDLGGGAIADMGFNGVLKWLKMRHMVRGQLHGRAVLMTAEQVINWQHANPGESIADHIEGAELYKPSDRVLRVMLGETGDQGARGVLRVNQSLDPSAIDKYEGVTPQVLERIPNWDRTTDFHSMPASLRATGSRLHVRPALTRNQLARVSQAMQYANARRTQAHEARAANWTDGQSTKNTARVSASTLEGLRAQNPGLDFMPTFGFVGAISESDSTVTEVVFHEYMSATSLTGYETAHIIEEFVGSPTTSATITQAQLDPETPGFKAPRLENQMVLGDFAEYKLDTIRNVGLDEAQTSALLEKRLQQVTSYYPTIGLTDATGRRELINEAGELLTQMGYERVAGSRHLYRPRIEASEYRNVEARTSTLTETHTESAHDVQLVFLAGPTTPVVNLDENSAAVVTDNPNASVALTASIVPINAYGSFGRPQGTAQVAKMVRSIENMLEGSEFAHLLQLSGIEDATSAEATQLHQALRDYVRDHHEKNGLYVTGARFGSGSIIPLVNNEGQILLYRHGHKEPKDLTTQFLAEVAPGEGAGNVAIYGAELREGATTYTGQVQAWNAHSQHGVTVDLRVPLQMFLDKVQLEGKGMKYLLVPDQWGLLPAHDIFGDAMGITIIADHASAAGKESATAGNFRDLWAIFGNDFVPELTQYFFNLNYASLSAAEQQAARAGVAATLSRINRMAGTLSADVVEQMLRLPYIENDVAQILKGIDYSGIEQQQLWLDKLTTSRRDESMASLVGRAAVLYMMTPSAQAKHFLTIGGLNNVGAQVDDTRTIYAPELFTNVFDRLSMDSPLRAALVSRMNGQITPGSGNEGYWVNNDLTVTIRGPQGDIRGVLMADKVFSSGDNPVLNAQAQERAVKQKLSRHSTDIAHEALNARMIADADLGNAERFAELRGEINHTSLWQMLAKHDPKKHTPSWLREMPAEQAYRENAYQGVKEVRTELHFGEEDRSQYDSERARVGAKYGLTEAQLPTVDYWVRAMTGTLAGDTAQEAFLSVDHAVQALHMIEWNHSRGLLPTTGSWVPQLHLNDLHMLYTANNGSRSNFTLKSGQGADAVAVRDWDGWVKTSLGAGFSEGVPFDALFLLANDGMMHSYQDATDVLVGTPVSRSVLKNMELMTEESNRLVVSIDPRLDRMLSDVVVLNEEVSTIGDLMGMERVSGLYTSKRSSRSYVTHQQKKMMEWRKENGIAVPVSVDFKDFRKQGSRFADHANSSSAIIRILTNLRVGNAMVNPQLWFAAGPEMWFRIMMTDITNIVSGQSTGTLGRAAQWMKNLAGATPRYNEKDLESLQLLYRDLGNSSTFKGELYHSLMYTQRDTDGMGKLERLTRKYAQIGGLFQDPSYGMGQATMARMYIERVMQEIHLEGMAITPQQLADRMRDPLYVQKAMPEIHQIALNHVSNTRSLRATPMSLMIRGIVDPMANSRRMPVNLMGGLIRMPLVFSGFLMNVVTTMTGMQGFATLAATVMDGRDKGVIGRMQAAIRGESLESDKKFDMSDAMDGMNLVQQFIQGGITHTGLMALGLAAGGLGLSGEDEEERRRRRAQLISGGQFLYDPRRIQNDFRNADAVYLDFLPPFISSWFRVEGDDGEAGRAMANMPWIIRQFISPIIGMERFFDSGNPMEILWGFQDAFGSMPLFNASMFDDASRMFAELTAAAEDAQATGTPEDLAASYGFLLSAVGTMERMLFENSFINMLYTGADPYDRDPWKIPLIDSERNIQSDRLGNTRATDALVDFRDPETGEIRSGYATREWMDATIHSLTENRLGLATLATIGSMFTGQGSGDYYRHNMAIKQRVIEKPALSLEEAKDLILTVWDGETYGAGQEVLTADGARGIFQALYSGGLTFDSPALDAVYVPLEMRQQIVDEWLAELTIQGMHNGLSQRRATGWAWDVMLGKGDSPFKIGIMDIIWSRDIPYAQTVRYNQLNTLYTMGPGGLPYATGVSRNWIMNGFGMLPSTYNVAGQMPTDSRLNSIDDVVRLNTGMRALERVDDSWFLPTDEEIGELIEKSLEEALENLGDRMEDLLGGGQYGNWRNGWRNYGRRGWGRSWSRGSSGYGSSSYVANYGGGAQRMNAQGRVQTPRQDDLYTINTSNPIIRRASLQRERFWSERGRLNQWQ